MTQNHLSSRIADALARIGALTRAHEQSGAQKATLSPLQARILVLLRRRSELRVGQIASELMVTYGTISAAASVLETKGLVTKTQDPGEHRAVVVSLTRKGQTTAEEADGWSGELLEPAMEGLMPKESSALLAVLLKLIRSFEDLGMISTTRMCITCKYFDPNKGNESKPHFCRLLEAPIGNEDLQVDCPDHQQAQAERLDELRTSFELTP